MDIERITELVTAEVKRALAQRGAASQAIAAASTASSGPLVAVLFTGGTYGLDDALSQLAQLRAEGLALRAVMSPAAEYAVGRDRVRATLGADTVIEADDVCAIRHLTENARAAVIATLTRNSAVKLALGITESDAMGVVYQILMAGKPVVAARNSADPDSADCSYIGLPTGPPALLELVRGYLDRLTSFGIELVDASEIADATRRAMGGGQMRKQGGPRAVITEADVIAAADAGSEITVGMGAIITPLARDAAQERGVRIVVKT